MNGYDKQERERLRAFFRQVHRRPAPSFEAVMQRRPGARHRAWTWAVAAATAAAIVAAGAAVLLQLPPAPEPGSDETLELARSLSSWEAPLDFLLEIPGREVLEAPTIVSPLPSLPATDDLNQEENS